MAEIAGLMYHEVTDDPRTSGFQRPGALPYTLTRAAFRRHLDAIAAGPMRPELVTQLDLQGNGKRHLLLTFDDGGASALHAGEELARRSWRGHFFIPTDMIGRLGYLDWDGVRAVAGMGHVIGSHSCSHPDRMAACSWEQLMAEWSGSAEVLARELGQPVRTASVPGGLYSRDVGRAAAIAGYTSLFT
ncbi:MAG: polysaccharide deacetylase family protein, partial [Burkholderiales bacterium]